MPSGYFQLVASAEEQPVVAKETRGTTYILYDVGLACIGYGFLGEMNSCVSH